MVEINNNQNSGDMNEMIDVNSVSEDGNENVNKNMSVSSNYNDLTDIDWQRSEDGSYSPSSYINRVKTIIK